MSNRKEPVDLTPLSYVAFWLGLFGWLTIVTLTTHGVLK